MERPMTASSTRTCPSCGASVVPDGACPACGFRVRAVVQADDLRGPGRAGVAFTVGWEVGFESAAQVLLGDDDHDETGRLREGNH